MTAEILDNAVLAALLALWIGPMALMLAGPRLEWVRYARRALAYAVVIMVGFVLVPHSVEKGGWIALTAVAAGALLPTLLERASRGSGRRSHATTAILVLLGLCAHAFVDGASLSLNRGLEDGGLGWAVAIHRVPVGLAAWMVARQIVGKPATLAALLAMTAATLAGVIVGPQLLDALADQPIAWFEAAVAGGLLHVLTHRVPREALTKKVSE